jgi:methylmalonyl-CoA/ethylmalonyl-CoA epimerase
MKIDHVCLAVRSIAAASPRLCAILGYSPKTEVVKNTIQDVNVQFLGKDGSMDIKLIEPASDSSKLVHFLRTKGEGLHHVCFLCDEVEKTLDEITAKGARVTAPPAPGEAFDEETIAFLYVAGGLNIELIDTHKRRALIHDNGHEVE